MGGGSWTASDWQTKSTKTRTQTQQQVFSQQRIHPDMNPKGVTMRESRDSIEHPESTAIIIGLDETGSMGKIPEIMIKEKLGILVGEVLDRKPVTDPQIMFLGIGDAYCDSAPLQVGQFESDITMTHWLEKIYLEGNGGGNGGESYTFPWYFAGLHTAIDCFEKRGKKGYLFTIGDEHYHDTLTRQQISTFCGDNVERDYLAGELLTLVSRQYHVFHLVITHGGVYGSAITDGWKALMGERALIVDDHNKIAEIIVSTMQVVEGADLKTVVNSWSGDTSLVVSNALGGLTAASNASGVVRL